MKAWILLNHSCQTLPGFCSMKQLGVFLLLLDGMLVHRRSFPCNLLGFPNNFLVPIYTPGWREALWELSVLPKNTTQCPRPGLEPGPLALGMSALTIRPPYELLFFDVYYICLSRNSHSIGFCYMIAINGKKFTKRMVRVSKSNFVLKKAAEHAFVEKRDYIRP